MGFFFVVVLGFLVFFFLFENQPGSCPSELKKEPTAFRAGMLGNSPNVLWCRAFCCFPGSSKCSSAIRSQQDRIASELTAQHCGYRARRSVLATRRSNMSLAGAFTLLLASAVFGLLHLEHDLPLPVFCFSPPFLGARAVIFEENSPALLRTSHGPDPIGRFSFSQKQSR